MSFSNFSPGCPCPTCGCCACADASHPTCTDTSQAVCVGNEWQCPGDLSTPHCADTTPPNCVNCPCCVGGCGYGLTPKQFKVVGLAGLFANGTCDSCTILGADPLIITKDQSGGYLCDWSILLPGICSTIPAVPDIATLSINSCFGGRNTFTASIGTAPNDMLLQWGTGAGFSDANCCEFTIGPGGGGYNHGACIISGFLPPSLTFIPIPECACGGCCSDRPVSNTLYWDWTVAGNLSNHAAAPCDTECPPPGGRIVLTMIGDASSCEWQYTSGSVIANVKFRKVAGVCTWTARIHDGSCYDLTYEDTITSPSCTGPVLPLVPGVSSQSCCVVGVDAGCAGIPSQISLSFPCPPL